MRRTMALAASLLALVALALVGATAAAADSSTATYTCTKEKKHGSPDVRVSVPETAVGGLTGAGFTCVLDTVADETQGDDQQDEQGDDQTQQDEAQSEDGDQGGDAGPETLPLWLSTVTVEEPSESRSVFCSTTGPVGRGEGAGVALDLPTSQGTLLVEEGLVNPGIYYAGLGVSCDLLPGYTYSGLWVDHVGNVVPGVAVYPYYVPAG